MLKKLGLDRPAGVLGLWAAYLFILMLILAVAFLPGRWSSWSITLPFYDALTAAIAAALEIILAVYAIRGHRQRRRAIRAGEKAVAVQFSGGTTILAIGLALIFLGIGFGAWAYFVGLGISLIGVGNLVRERLAVRRILAAEREAAPVPPRRARQEEETPRIGG